MKDFKKVSQEYEANMKTYDGEVETQNIEFQKCQNDFNDAAKELDSYT
jgi:hypothetical protein